MRKNTRLSPPAQLQCSHSGAEEPGNEAILIIHHAAFQDRYYTSRKILYQYGLSIWHIQYMGSITSGNTMLKAVGDQPSYGLTI